MTCDKSVALVVMLLVVMAHLVADTGCAHQRAGHASEAPTSTVLGLVEQHLDLDPVAGVQRRESWVRVVFRRGPRSWQAFEHAVETADQLDRVAHRYPERVTWTVCRHGVARGRVRSERVTPTAYFEIGKQVIVGGSPTGTSGTPSARYSRWPGLKERPPLLLTSVARCVDPDGWQQASDASHQVQRRAAEALQRAVEKRARANAGDVDDESPQHYRFSPSNVRAHRVLRDRGAALLLLLDVEDDEGNQHDECVLLRVGKPAWVVAGVRELVDVGDYDNDGHSELILIRVGHNRSSYVLLQPRAEQAVSFAWSYH